MAGPLEEGGKELDAAGVSREGDTPQRGGGARTGRAAPCCLVRAPQAPRCLAVSKAPTANCSIANDSRQSSGKMARVEHSTGRQQWQGDRLHEGWSARGGGVGGQAPPLQGTLACAVPCRGAGSGVGTPHGTAAAVPLPCLHPVFALWWAASLLVPVPPTGGHHKPGTTISQGPGA